MSKLDMSNDQILDRLQNFEALEDGTFAVVGQRYLIELTRIDCELHVIEVGELIDEDLAICNASFVHASLTDDFKIIERHAFSTRESAHAFFFDFISSKSHI